MWFNNNRMLYIYLHGNILLNFETSHCTVYPNSWFKIPNLFLMLPLSFFRYQQDRGTEHCFLFVL